MLQEKARPGEEMKRNEQKEIENKRLLKLQEIERKRKNDTELKIQLQDEKIKRNLNFRLNIEKKRKEDLKKMSEADIEASKRVQQMIDIKKERAKQVKLSKSENSAILARKAEKYKKTQELKQKSIEESVQKTEKKILWTSKVSKISVRISVVGPFKY